MQKNEFTDWILVKLEFDREILIRFFPTPPRIPGLEDRYEFGDLEGDGLLAIII